jgi:hypothetical protein
MTWLLILLVPVVLLMFAVQGLAVAELWRVRRQRPRFPDLRRRDQVFMVTAFASGLGIAALIGLGYGQLGATILLVVFGSFAVVGVAMVPLIAWADKRGSPALKKWLLGRRGSDEPVERRSVRP